MKLLSLVCLLLIVSPAGSAEPKRPKELTFSAPPMLPIATAVRVLTPEKRTRLEALAATTVELLRDRDTFALREIGDIVTYSKAVYAGLGLPPENQAALEKGHQLNFGPPTAGLLNPMVKPEVLHVGFVRLGEDNGEVFARFRLAFTGMTFEYWDLFPVESPDGRLRWVDCRTSTSWERKTTGVRRLHHATSAESGLLGPKAANKLTEADKFFLKFSGLMEPLWKDPERLPRKEIFEILDAHKAVVDRNRKFSLMRIDVMGVVSDPKDYAAEIGNFVERFPDDPTVPLLVLWGHIAANRNEEAFAAVDGVATAFGPDPYLDGIRAAIRWQQKRPEEGIVFARKAAASCPDAPLGLILLASFSAQTGDFATTESSLKQQMAIDMIPRRAATVKALPGFGSFCDSEVGRKFLSTLPP